MRPDHPPTRTEALSRLQDFLPHAGRDYAARRNYDLAGHPNVSVLSPYIRHRLITEEEVLAAVLGRFARSTAEKFIQEVFWRTYWKGWLEMRPGVWSDYRRGVRAGLDRVATEAGLRAQWEAACKGETGIDAFDHWARELAETGYLHNHARMWFASIWIFTLELPWELGADFFLRHLLDGDAASNTLSWRWVAGLQTRGKHYLARGANIAKYTEGRFNPGYQLNTGARPLEGPPPPERSAAPKGGKVPQTGRIGWLLTDEDLSPGPLIGEGPAAATLFVTSADARSPLTVAPGVSAFADGAFADTASRYSDRLGKVTGPVRLEDLPDSFEAWIDDHRLDAVVMPHVPVGPAADGLAGLIAVGRITPVLRPYDAMCWPNATVGFFGFKKKIPALLDGLGLVPAA
ncbi:MAG: FAD-binding domain-containing protein [Paracoccaceae bacterium]|nr:FAD-binding domain-containing protein [Paracoccaceae bacterium]